jgi:hypothetical protein
MCTLSKAIAAKNWQLAAHIIVYAAAQIAVNGGVSDDSKSGKKSKAGLPEC